MVQQAATTRRDLIKEVLKTGAYATPAVLAIARPVSRAVAVSPPMQISGMITQVCNPTVTGPVIFVTAAITLTGIAPDFRFDIYLLPLANGMRLPPSNLPLAIGMNLVTDARGNAQIAGTTLYRTIPATLEADTFQVQVLPAGASLYITNPQYTALITPQNTPCT